MHPRAFCLVPVFVFLLQIILRVFMGGDLPRLEQKQA